MAETSLLDDLYGGEGSGTSLLKDLYGDAAPKPAAKPTTATGKGIQANAERPAAAPLTRRQKARAAEADAAFKRANTIKPDGVGGEVVSRLSRGVSNFGAGFNRGVAPLLDAAGLPVIAERQRGIAAKQSEAAQRPIAGEVSVEQFLDNPSIVGALKAGFGTLLESTPEMLLLGSPLGLGASAVSRTGAIANDRANNNGEREANLRDLAIAAPFAAGSVALDRLGLDNVFKGGGKTALGRIISGAGGEALTEGAQSALEYTGGSLGTDQGFKADEFGRQVKIGAAGGALAGGGLAGSVEVVNAPFSKRPTAPGERETKAAEAVVTPADEASPIPTELIAKGRAAVNDALGVQGADTILEAAGLPRTGKRVTINLPEGDALQGTIEDAFDTDAGDAGRATGVKIKLDDGTIMSEHFDDLAEAGITISENDPRAEADAIDARLAAEAGSAPIEAPAPPQPRAAKQGGYDLAALKAKIRGPESGGNDNAVNRAGSSASGRYQFVEGTFKSLYAKVYGTSAAEAQQGWERERFDPVVQERLMDALVANNEAVLRRKGLPVNEGSLYTMHVLGEGDGPKLLAADPNLPTQNLLSKQIVSQNAAYFKDKTVGQALAIIAGKVGASAATGTPLPVSRETEEGQAAPAAEEPMSANYQAAQRGDTEPGWERFLPDSGTLDIPRAEMPQIKAEDRSALVQFLAARGVANEQEEVPAAGLKAAQAEFSPEKVQKAIDYEGGNRAILVSNDGYILDGHHQALAAAQTGDNVRTIKLDAPIRALLDVVNQFPSVTRADGATPATEPARTEVVQSAPQPGQSAIEAAPAATQGQRGVTFEDMPSGASVVVRGVGRTETERARIAAASPTGAAPLWNSKRKGWVVPKKNVDAIRAAFAGQPDIKVGDKLAGGVSVDDAATAARATVSKKEIDQLEDDILGMSFDEYSAFLDDLKPKRNPNKNAITSRAAQISRFLSNEGYGLVRASADKIKEPPTKETPDDRKPADLRPAERTAGDGVSRTGSGKDNAQDGAAVSQPLQATGQSDLNDRDAGQDRDGRVSGEPRRSDTAAEPKRGSEVAPAVQGREQRDLLGDNGPKVATTRAEAREWLKEPDHNTIRVKDSVLTLKDNGDSGWSVKVARDGESVNFTRGGTVLGAWSRGKAINEAIEEVFFYTSDELFGNTGQLPETSGNSEQLPAPDFAGAVNADLSNKQVDAVAAIFDRAEKRQSGYGANNKAFTSEAADKARAVLRAKMSQINSAGFDPELAQAGMTLMGYHIEAGARAFIDAAKATAQDLGVSPVDLRNSLRSWYMAARVWMEDNSLDVRGMDDSDAVKVDLSRIDTWGKAEVTNAPEPATQAAGADLEIDNANDAKQESVEGNREAGDVGRNAQGDAPSPRGGDAGSDTGGSRTGGAGNLSANDSGASGSDGADLGEADSGKPAAAKSGNRNSTQPGDRVPSGRKPERADRGVNYSAPTGSLAREGSWRAAASRNLDIIELVNRISSERRPATAEEQQLLSKFVGWGAGEIRNNLFKNIERVGMLGRRKIIPPSYGEWKDIGERAAKLLTDIDLETALQSVQYAHYTSEEVIRSIWEGVARLGFSGGKILEPGMGNGLFAVAAPRQLMQASSYTGIELDGFTSKVAGLLLPQENIISGDFTKQQFPDGFFDLAIGNPPFAKVKVTDDPAYRKLRLSLHDYFFAKSIDKVRPGGLLVFVTSRYTMDKQEAKARDYIAERADLLGAIRLPQTAFKENAGTEVVTDVLFLQKRAAGVAPAGKAWTKLDTITRGDAKGKMINQYFIENPSMVLGSHATTGSMYRADEYTVEPPAGKIETAFKKAIDNLPEKAMFDAPAAASAELKTQSVEYDMVPTANKEGGVYIKDGALLVRDQGVGKPLTSLEKLSAKDQVWLKDYVPLRDAVKQAQKDQLLDGDWEKSLAALNKVYDGFVKKHGPVSAFTTSERASTDSEGKPVTLTYRRFSNRLRLAMDVEGTLVEALEKISDDGSISKGAFLTGRTLKKPARREIGSATDAVAVSLDEIGKFDIAYVAKLLARPQEEVIAELGDEVFQLGDGSWIMADEYLSGDVVAKLDEAEIAAKADPRFTRNMEALIKVQPSPLAYSDISVKLGAAWIEPSVVELFAQEVLGEGIIGIRYEPLSATWTVPDSGSRYQRSSASEWGTADRTAKELLTALLNNRSIKITRTDSSGGKKTTYTDQEATALANERADKIADRFKSWIWTDGPRAQRLTEKYNRSFNNLAPRKFDGSHLTFPGLSTRYTLYPHQKRAIWRIIAQGSTYLDHAVGAGKTLEMIVAGMEMRRLGLITKPMYVVPNHMLNQFSREFLDAYPAANIMVADEKAFHTGNRRRFMAQAALNNPDAIIVSHSSFGKIAPSDVARQAVAQQFIEELEAAQESLGADDRVSRSKLESQIEQMKRRFEGKAGTEGKDKALTFEETGVDFLFIDEAHEFRKLDFATNRTAVKGIDPNGSQKALDMYIKTLTLAKARPGRSLVMASGTPVTNTMAEIYTVMRYMDQAGLERDGMQAFDAWASMFGEVVSGFEQNAAGGYEMVERFAKFVNVPELMSRVRKFMDVLTNDELGSLVKRPEIKGGLPENVVAEASPELKQFMKITLQERIKVSRAWKPSKDQPGNPDPVINIITDGRLSAIDMRFMNPRLPNDPESKLNKMIDNIIETHKRFEDVTFIDNATGKPFAKKGATQIVFSAVGFGDQVAISRGFDARAWVNKRLAEAGVTSDAVAWMNDQNTHAKKETTFKAMRGAEKRILLGSPKNMGTGVNVQARLKALHFLSPPWYPSDIEQPHGRIVRQGNMNTEVELSWYATKGTYDSTAWGMVSRKQRFIEQAFRGDASIRSIEDISEANQYEMAAALAAGDERAIQLAGLSNEIERMTKLQSAHSDEQQSLRWKVKNGVLAIERMNDRRARLLGAIEVRGTTTEFKMIVGRTEYDKPGLAGDALIAAIDKALADFKGVDPASVEIARYQGTMPVMVEIDVQEYSRPDGTTIIANKFDVVVQVGPVKLDVADALRSTENLDAVGFAGRVTRAVNKLTADLAITEREIVDTENEQRRANNKLGAPFEYQGQLGEKIAERARLQQELTDETTAANEKDKQEAKPAPAQPAETAEEQDVAAESAPIEDVEAVEQLPQAAPESYEGDPRWTVETIAALYAEKLGTDISDYHRATARSIIDKDARKLKVLSNGLNKKGLAVFSEVTGLSVPKTQSGQWAVIRDWGGISEAEDARFDADKADANKAETVARERQFIINMASNTKLKTQSGEVISVKQYIDDKIAEGFTELANFSKGAVPKYGLRYAGGRGFYVTGAMLKYARVALEMKAEGLSPDASVKLLLGDVASIDGPLVQGDIEGVWLGLNARMKQYGIEDRIALRVVENIAANPKALGSFTPGQTTKGGRRYQGLIEVAMSDYSAAYVFDHEAIHALREIGVFRPSEWTALSKAAKADTTGMARVRNLWKGLGLSEDQLIEEAVAEMFAGWREDGAARGFIRSAFERIKALLDALASWAKGNGWTTADQVMRGIVSGKIGSSGRVDGRTEFVARAETLFAITDGPAPTEFTPAPPPRDEDPLVATFKNPTTEKRFNEAKKGIASQSTFRQRVAEKAERTWAGMTRHWINLPNDPVYAALQEKLRQIEAAPTVAKERGVRMLDDLIKGMSEADLDLFSRKVVLDDLAWSARFDKDLPFGLTKTSLAKEKANIDAMVEAQEGRIVWKAVMKRKMINRGIAEELVKAGVLEAGRIKNPAYFRHMVIDYARARQLVDGTGTKLRSPMWPKREDSLADINANLIEAEFDWLNKAFVDIKVASSIEWIKASEHNIMPALVKQAKEKNKAGVDAKLEAAQKALTDRASTDEDIAKAAAIIDQDKKFRQMIGMGFADVTGALRSGKIDIPPQFKAVAQGLLDKAEGNDPPFEFLSWIIDENAPGAMGALTILKTATQRRLWTKMLLGKEYIDSTSADDLLRIAPEGYAKWTPSEALLFTVKTIPEHVIDNMLTKLDSPQGVDPNEFRGALENARTTLASGSARNMMIVPEPVALTLDNLRRTPNENLFVELAKKPVQYWKRWVLINPRRYFKYNFNNITGDFDAIMAGNPKLLRFVGQAGRELAGVMRGKAKPTTRYEEALERGVFDSGLTVQEIPDIHTLAPFEKYDPNRGKISKLALMPLRKAWGVLQGSTQWRENVFRYAAYLDYAERIEAGESQASIGYGASRPEMVDWVKDDKDRAALLARDLVGDYGAISHYGAGIRESVIPFWSWMEINTRRYWRLTLNAYSQGVGKGIATGGALAVATGARNSAMLAAQMAAFYGLVTLWNGMLFGDEEDELTDEQRRQLHIILGRNDNGEIVSMRAQGALSDALSWFGLSPAIDAFKDAELGRGSPFAVVGEVAKAPINKLGTALSPTISLPLESATGKKFWPDLFNVRENRDPWRNIAQSVSIENEYDALLDKPTRGYARSWQEALIYRRDPGEMAYNESRGLVYGWLEREKGRKFRGGISSESGDVLRDYRTALKFDDMTAADEALARMVDFDIDQGKLDASIKQAHPLGPLAKKDRQQFVDQLTTEEYETFQRAELWYNQTFLGR